MKLPRCQLFSDERIKAGLTLVLTLLYATTVQADDERLFVDAKVNGQPVHFAFDTGLEVPFLLFSTTAQKLNLKVAPPQADTQIGPGQIRAGWTDTQKVDFGFTNVETKFAVAELPEYLRFDVDGLIGWPALSNNVVSFDCALHAINAFTNFNELSKGWIRCRIQTNSDLTLQLPGGNSPGEIIVLDSGSPFGVEITPEKWREWKAAHTNQQITLNAYYAPGAGLVVAEEAWADKISLGSLTFTAVPVTEADSGDIAFHSSPQTRYAATLGFAAMKRLDIVLDGKQGVVWLRPTKLTPQPYAHNHLGAVFVPQNPKSDDLIAHVVAGSPAVAAGIRSGDILLKIGELDCTEWRTNPAVLPLSRFFESPTGTKLELTLKRGDKSFKTIVTLRSFLPPEPAANPN